MIIDGMLKYHMGTYERRITTLETYTGILRGHLDTLNGYKAELGSVWSDTESKKMENLIEVMINQIYATLNNIENSYMTLQDIVGQMDQQTGAVTEMIDDGLGFVKALSM